MRFVRYIEISKNISVPYPLVLLLTKVSFIGRSLNRVLGSRKPSFQASAHGTGRDAKGDACGGSGVAVRNGYAGKWSANFG